MNKRSLAVSMTVCRCKARKDLRKTQQRTTAMSLRVPHWLQVMYCCALPFASLWELLGLPAAPSFPRCAADRRRSIAERRGCHATLALHCRADPRARTRVGRRCAAGNTDGASVH